MFIVKLSIASLLLRGIPTYAYILWMLPNSLHKQTIKYLSQQLWNFVFFDIICQFTKIYDDLWILWRARSLAMCKLELINKFIVAISSQDSENSDIFYISFKHYFLITSPLYNFIRHFKDFCIAAKWVILRKSTPSPSFLNKGGAMLHVWETILQKFQVHVHSNSKQTETEAREVRKIGNCQELHMQISKNIQFLESRDFSFSPKFHGSIFFLPRSKSYCLNLCSKKKSQQICLRWTCSLEGK